MQLFDEDGKIEPREKSKPEFSSYGIRTVFRQTLPRRTFRRWIVLGRHFPDGQFPEGQFPEVQFPKWKFPEQTFPRRTVPRMTFPRTEISPNGHFSEMS